jgi:hypothetical protein
MTYWCVTICAFTDWGSREERGICSAMNQSGPKMKAATQPATLFLLSESNGCVEEGARAYSEIGSRTVITNLGMGGRIEVIFATQSFRWPLGLYQ